LRQITSIAYRVPILDLQGLTSWCGLVQIPLYSLRDWKESFRAGIKGFESVHDRNLWACTRVLGVQESLKDKGKWGYFIKLPEGLSDKEGELFIMGFVRRIDGLISGAKYYQDISFPAVITTTGK